MAYSGMGAKVKRRRIRQLLERDGDCCQLCKAPIELTLQRDDPMAVTLDHLIPRSRGGSNSVDNLRLAHRICNQRRADARDEKLSWHLAFERNLCR